MYFMGWQLNWGWLLLLLTATAWSQETNVWNYSLVDDSAIVHLDPAQLDALEIGERFTLRLTENPEIGTYTGLIDHISYHDNGDISWEGSLAETGNQHSVVITRGQSAAYASISSPVGVYQLSAAAVEDGLLRGELLRYSPVRAQLPDEDFVRPDGELTDVTGSGNGFTLTQSIGSRQLAVGETAEITLTLDYAGASVRPDVYVDIFFLLENTNLLSAPDFCFIAESSQDQPVLSCQLGDLMPGTERTFSYEVETGSQSHPLVFSTALVEEVRSDLTLEIYRDVLADSDQDGVSDFNESLLGSDPLNPFSVSGGEDSVIDLLAVYAGDATEVYGEQAQTRLNQLLAVANKIYRDSQVAIRLRVAETLATDYRPGESLLTDLKHITYKSDPAFDEVDKHRNASGADMVVLFRTGMGDGSLCGLANLVGKGTRGDLSADYQRKLAYSVINMNCLDDSALAHELGHNMGLVHSKLEDPSGGTFAYSAGYGVDTQFVSVMAYSGDYQTDNKVFRFSNPEAFCGPFFCGVEESNTVDGANAVKTLNLVRHQIADYGTALEQRLPALKVSTLFTGEVLTRVNAGARISGGVGFSSFFKDDDTIDVLASIRVDPDHVGRLADRYLVVHISGQGLYQFDNAGDLVPWSGNFAGLAPLRQPAPLPEDFVFEGLSNFRPMEHGIGSGRLSVFFGYRLLDSGMLVYTRQPLVISISSGLSTSSQSVRYDEDTTDFD